MFGGLGLNRNVGLVNLEDDGRQMLTRSDRNMQSPQMETGFWISSAGRMSPYRRVPPEAASNWPMTLPSRDETVCDDGKTRTNFKSWFSSKEKERLKKNHQTNGASSEHTPDKMKTKFISMWNNMKYGWTVKLKTNFSRDSAIWLLGHPYHHKTELRPEPSPSIESDNIFQEFQQDFFTRIWLTYRREFQELDGSSLTTDCGWGCMIRSGQMLLAEGLVRHFMGRDWRFKPMEQSKEQNNMHRQIIRWFGDIPDDNSPFALHHLVAIGKNMGKKAGDWYGPASVAHILKHAMENALKNHPLLKDLRVYVAQDCTVYKQDVLNLCMSDSGWRGVIIFVPVRLGGESFNIAYAYCVRAFLSATNCIGIIGGRPKHSLHFVGWQDEKLIHLDPHYCQEVVDFSKEDFPLQSFHCLSPRKMALTRMDPSCTIGFYCDTREQFDEFIRLSQAVVSKHSANAIYPIFVVAEGTSEECNMEHNFPEESFMCRDYRLESDLGSELDSEEEFVVL